MTHSFTADQALLLDVYATLGPRPSMGRVMDAMLDLHGWDAERTANVLNELLALRMHRDPPAGGAEGGGGT